MIHQKTVVFPTTHEDKIDHRKNAGFGMEKQDHIQILNLGLPLILGQVNFNIFSTMLYLFDDNKRIFFLYY